MNIRELVFVILGKYSELQNGPITIFSFRVRKTRERMRKMDISLSSFFEKI